MTPSELENRLINFAVAIVTISEDVKKTFAGKYYSNQMIRSGGSPALHYDEVRSAESTKDFVHKMGVCLKELRETFNCLKIIEKANLFKGDKNKFKVTKDENDQLISIFVTSINTSRNKRKK